MLLRAEREGARANARAGSRLVCRGKTEAEAGEEILDLLGHAASRPVLASVNETEAADGGPTPEVGQAAEPNDDIVFCVHFAAAADQRDTGACVLVRQRGCQSPFLVVSLQVHAKIREVVEELLKDRASHRPLLLLIEPPWPLLRPTQNLRRNPRGERSPRNGAVDYGPGGDGRVIADLYPRKDEDVPR